MAVSAAYYCCSSIWTQTDFVRSSAVWGTVCSRQRHGRRGIRSLPLDLPKQHDKGDKVRRFTFDDITRDLRQLTVIFQLLGVLAEKQIDLIHANSLAASLIGGVAAKLYGVSNRDAQAVRHRVWNIGSDL